jgi:hypothetical protein
MNATAQMSRVGIEAVVPHRTNPRLGREFKTIKAMVQIFGAEKPTCAKCQVTNLNTISI